ncbi:hypothetical protein SNEBB_008172 [Seison nebaliae]|nr:hypothetical protein SNEBB_008172 [Seison nebaliae]
MKSSTIFTFLLLITLTIAAESMYIQKLKDSSLNKRNNKEIDEEIDMLLAYYAELLNGSFDNKRSFDMFGPGKRSFDMFGPGKRSFDMFGPGKRSFDMFGPGKRSFDMFGPGKRSVVSNLLENYEKLRKGHFA